MQLVPRCISTIAMQLRPSFVIEERFHSFRRRRVEKEDLSQETLPTDVVGKILKTLQSAENYFHARGPTNFSATKMAHDCK